MIEQKAQEEERWLVMAEGRDSSLDVACHARAARVLRELLEGCVAWSPLPPWATPASPHLSYGFGLYYRSGSPLLVEDRRRWWRWRRITRWLPASRVTVYASSPEEAVSLGLEALEKEVGINEPGETK